MEHAIACTHVRKRIGNFSLSLDQLTVKKGTVHGLIGANGSGKTTTIRLLLGLLTPDEGSVTVLSSSAISQDTEVRNAIGFIVDEASIPSMLTPKDIGAVFGRIYREWDAKTYERLVKQFKLEERKPYRKCSRGMKVKFLLAIALSHHASLLVLDEPTSGLDPFARDEVLSLLADFCRDEEHTLFISSHITSDLEKLCDYITFLENGEIRFTEEKDSLLEHYRLVRTSHAMLSDFDPASIVAMKDGSFHIELLMKTDDIPSFAESERIGLEELVLLLAKGVDKK